MENDVVPQIKFVVDKKLDFENHLVGLKSWETKLHSLTSGNEYFQKLSGKTKTD